MTRLRTKQELGDAYEDVYRSDYILIYRHKANKHKSTDFDGEGFCRWLLPYIVALVPGTTLRQDSDGKRDTFQFPNGLIIRPSFGYQQMGSGKIAYHSGYPQRRKLDGWHYGSKFFFPDAGISYSKTPQQIASEIIKRVYKPCEDTVKAVDEAYATQEREKAELANLAKAVAADYGDSCKLRGEENGRKYYLDIKVGKRSLDCTLTGSSISLKGFGDVTQTQLNELFTLMGSWE